MQEDYLKQRMLTFARHYVESRQVAKRLRDLLSNRLSELVKRHRCKRNTAAKSSRLALLDPEYEVHIDEFLKVNAAAHSAKIEWECRKMALLARQSLRKYHKPDVRETR